MKNPKSDHASSPSTTGSLDPLESPRSAVALAADLGVDLSTPMRSDDVWRLRKALPGYTSLLDDASAALAHDAALLGFKDLTPELLIETKRRQRFLAAREVVVQDVYQSIYQQRLQADDAGMAMLQKIARRIDALSEDEPSLPQRWKFLLDFLGTFRKGSAQKAAPPGGAPVTGAIAVSDGSAK